MSGNPVKFGDGCATVLGYKLPLATSAKAPGRRERGQAPSQDTGLIVLVAIASAIGFSVKEKDETSHPTVSGGLTFIPCFAGV